MFIKNYFGKDLEEISLQDVQDFFQFEREETTRLEFKSYSEQNKDSVTEKEKGILRSICGFLNSEGGLIIWGAPQGSKVDGKKEKIFVGDLAPVDIKYEKDALMSKILDSITPTPNGIKYKMLPIADKYIYVIEVPKSETSPHQFGDKFYMRLDGQTRVAPHHFVEALFRKVTFPNIGGYVKLLGFKELKGQSPKLYLLRIQVIFLNFSGVQNDYNLSYRIICSNGTFHGWNLPIPIAPNVKYDQNGHEKRVTSIKEVIHYGEPIHEEATLAFPESTLITNEWKTEIMLFFGAKLSPMKMSLYTIKLDSTESEESKDYNSWIVELNENTFMFDNTEITEREKIKLIVGR